MISEYNFSVIAVCETIVPSVSSSFDGFRVVRRNGSQSTRKHDCCLYVGYSVSFVPIDADLINVAVDLLDLYEYILAMYRPILVLFSKMKVWPHL